jgi:nucleoside-diphosphate-sugar epimerase
MLGGQDESSTSAPRDEALEGKLFAVVVDDGLQTRSLRYVDDVIRALYVLAMADEHIPVKLRNPDHELTILRLVEAMPVDEPRERRPGITNAVRMLGCKPEVGLEEGSARWVRASGRAPVRV